MIRTSIDRTSNPRLKSFLSPFRYGIRSASTSESHPALSNPIQSQKSYIDFPRAQRAQGQKTSAKQILKIRMQDFNKKQNKTQKKLLKFPMNRHRQKQENKYIILESQQTEKEWQKNSDVLYLVRQLKQKIMTVELENKKLKEMQESNERRIIKQDEIIRNLEQALYLIRGKASYSCFQKQNKVTLNCTRVLRPQKDISHQICSQSFQIKMAQLVEQNKKLHLECSKLQNQLKIVAKNQQNKLGSEAQGCKTCNRININSIQHLLGQIELKKRKQFQQINSLLFEPNKFF